MTTILRQEAGNPTIDKFSGAIKTIPNEHAKIHDGNAYSHAGIHLALANNGIYYHRVTVPAGKFPHLRQILVSCEGAAFWMELFEAPTITLAGTSAAVINCNRNSSNTSLVTMEHSPTVGADGTFLDALLIPGTGASGGMGSGIESEWILKPSTDYLVKITNKSGATKDFSLSLFWYE